MDVTFQQQNTMIDALINEMYKYNLYGRYKTIDPATDIDSSSDISQSLYDTKNTQKSLLQIMDVYGEDLSNTYHYSEDMNYDQTSMKNLMAEEHATMKRRNEDVVDANQGNQRQHELYSYYYYKYRVQLNILYVFLALVAFLILITFLNRNLSFVLNDNMYVVLVGLSTAYFIIYVGRNIYDLLLRSDRVFDEYDANWSPPHEIQGILYNDKEEKKRLELEKKCEQEKTNI